MPAAPPVATGPSIVLPILQILIRQKATAIICLKPPVFPPERPEWKQIWEGQESRIDN